MKYKHLLKLTDEQKIQLGYKKVVCRSITKNGKVIYPKKSKFFVFWVKS